MQAANRVATNTFILYGRMFVTVFISLYATRLLLAALGAVDYGLFNVVAGSVAMLGFLHAAMASSSMRFMSHAQGAGDLDKVVNIFNVSFSLHILIALIVFIFFEIAGLFFFDGFLKIPEDRVFASKVVFHCVVASTVFTIISVPYNAVINARENMLLFSITSIIEVLFRLGIAIYITYTDFDKLIIYGGLTALSSIIILLIQRIYCHIKYEECKIGLIKYFDKELFKQMTSFGGWSFISSFLAILNNYGTAILINRFFTPMVNAAQGVANQVNGQVGSFSSVMLKALNPALVKSEGAGKRDRLLKASMTGSKLAFALFALLSVPVFIEMPYVLEVWIKKFPESTVIFCRLLLLKSLMEQPFFILTTSIGAQGNIKKPTIAKMFVLVLIIPITYMLYSIGQPPYIIYIVFIVINLIKDSINIYFSKVILGLSIPNYLKEVVLKCLLFITILVAITLIPNYYMIAGGLRFLVVFTTCCIVFMLSFYFILINNSEKKLIIGFVNKISIKLLKRNLIK